MRPTCPKDLRPWAWASEYTLVSIYLVCLLILNQSFLHSNSQKNKRVNALFKNVIYIAQRFALVFLYLLRLGEGREFIGCYLLIIYFAIRVRVARDLANKAGNG